MSSNVLRVRAVGAGLVAHHERLEAEVNAARRFIGRKKEADPNRPGAFRFMPTGKIEELPIRAEYINALRSGDLEAADEETATAAGVTFTPPKTDEPAAAPTSTKEETSDHD